MIPWRRESEIVTFPWPGSQPVYDVRLQFSRNPDGDIYEVFIRIFKHRSVKMFDNEVAESQSDWGKLLSLTLQDGTPIESIATRMRRGDNNESLSLMGATADAICAEQHG